MAQILSEQTLEVENLMTFRGKVTQAELAGITRDLENQIVLAGGKRVGNPITATYGMDGNLVDVEILLPVDRPMPDIEKYIYKKKLRIVNSVVAQHIGNPMRLQETCNELNQYMLEKGLMPITVGYNVTKKVDPANIENTEIDVYVGINPNIL